MKDKMQGFQTIYKSHSFKDQTRSGTKGITININQEKTYFDQPSAVSDFFLGQATPFLIFLIQKNRWIFHDILTIHHRIGLWENLQESPIFDGKNHGFL